MSQVLVLVPGGLSARTDDGRGRSVGRVRGEVRAGSGSPRRASTGLSLVPAPAAPAAPTGHDRRRAPAASDGSLADLRLTRRGRWVLWSTAVVTALLMAVMGGAALASSPAEPLEVLPYTVSQGENLWAIAASIAEPGEDLRDVVDLIVSVNGRSSAALWAGEQIMLPVRP